MATLKLLNVGNSCYINSSLQLLYSVTKFRDFICRRDFHMPGHTWSQPVCEELHYLFTNPSQLNSACTLRHLVAVSMSNNNFNNATMQDSEEFLLATLEIVFKELSEYNVVGRAMIGEFIGRESRIRKFQLQNVSGSCPVCQTLPRGEEENFKVLTLDLPIVTDISLELSSLIASHFAESFQTTPMKCSNCCKCRNNCPQTGKCRLRPSVEQLSIVKSPDELIIRLNRFNNGFKNQTHVIPDEFIQLNEDFFRLKVSVDHIGSTLNSGHYIAHIKSGGKWITCNDSNISESFNEMCGRSRNNFYYLYSKIVKTKSAIRLCGEWQELKGRTLPVGPYDTYCAGLANLIFIPAPTSTATLRLGLTL